MDKSLIWDSKTQTWDIGYNSNGQAVTDNLDTQVYLALFSDTRANKSEIPQAELRNGFWGNIFGDDHGSKLWLNNGLKTRDNLNAIVDYAKKSLSFLVDNGILNNIEIQGAFTDNGASLDITLTYLSNDKKTLTLEV